MELIRGIDDSVNHAILFGHNPGFDGLARTLTANFSGDQGGNFPTCGVAVIKLECKCSYTLTLPDRLAGQKIRCKRCAKVLTVPQPRMQIPATNEDSFAGAMVSDEALRVRGMRACPGCKKPYPPSVQICVGCGLNIDSGAMLYASIEEDTVSPVYEAEKNKQAEAGFFARLLSKLGLGGKS